MTKAGSAGSASGRARRSPRSTAATTPALPSPTSPQHRYEHRVANLLMKVTECDWHGVADEAMDIRELIAAYPELRKHEERLWSRRSKT